MNNLNNNQNNQIFKKLKQYLEKEITCEYYDNGTILTETFKLDYVEDYECIATNIKDKYGKYLHIINFIWYNQFIISITNTEGEILYKNNNPIEELTNIKNKDELIKKQKLVFGENYVSIVEQNSKEYLIKKGLEHIEDSSKEEWIEFVEHNVEYNAKIIKATISMLQKINQGCSFYEAEIKVYRDEFNLSGYETNLVDSAVKRFCKYPQLYFEYLIKAKNGTLFENKTKKKTRCIRKPVSLKNN